MFKNLSIIMFCLTLIIILCSCSNGNNYGNYMDHIALFSSQTFDYENPNYSNIYLNSNSEPLRLNTEDTYKIISKFNDISFKFSTYSEGNREEIEDKIEDAIRIEVSYKYSISTENTDDAIVNFYILKNGMLVFKDRASMDLIYTRKHVVSYNKIKNLINSLNE